MKRIYFIQPLLAAGIVFLAFAQAQAQIHSLTVTVEGMSCPFCAFGVEKRLKKVEGVESITVSMKDGTAAMSARKGQSINFSQVPAAIRKAGFTPGTMRVVVTGTVKADDKQHLFLQFNSEHLPLAELKEPLKEELLSRVRSGESVEVRGIVRQQMDGTWTLLPESLSPVPK